MSSVDRDVVRRVAELARLRLDDAQVETFTAQLGAIVDYVDVLDRLPEGSAPPPSEGGAPLRADQPVNADRRDALLAGAPDTVDGRVRVPTVVGGDLE